MQVLDELPRLCFEDLIVTQEKKDEAAVRLYSIPQRGHLQDHIILVGIHIQNVLRGLKLLLEMQGYLCVPMANALTR